MAGAEFLPQVSVLQHVDLVITHAGNNTITECLHFGKPMVALPLFWDQHDNAQRLEETGFGRRLSTYSFSDEQMSDAIDGLLSDRQLATRLSAASGRLRADSGNEQAAKLIERLAVTGEPIVSGSAAARPLSRVKDTISTNIM